MSVRGWMVAAVAMLAWGSAAAEKPRKEKPVVNKDAIRLLETMDANRDGQLSREEYKGSDAVFAQLDADGDGAIRAEEAAEAANLISVVMWDLVDREALFKALDADGDGAVTAEELKQANLAEIMAKALGGAKQQLAGGAGEADFVARLDKDGDGRISRNEFPPEKLAAFDKLDRNADGFVDAEELARAKVRGGKAGGKADLVQQLDANGDGKVSRDEFPQGKIQAFDRLDANGDGFITPEELDGGKAAKPEAAKPAEF